MSTGDELTPTELDIVRRAVEAGEPITDPYLAPAAIAEAERVRRANRRAWGRLIVVALVLAGVAVFQLAGGELAEAAIAGTVAVALLAFWRSRSDDVRKAAVTKASAEALLREAEGG